jgi:hypothetical protein
MTALSLLASIGWAAYGLSAKAKDDIEARLRAVEISLSSVSTSLNSLTATIAERGQRRDVQFTDIMDRVRDLEHRGR